MAIRVLGENPTVVGGATATGAPITAVPVPGWDVPSGYGVFMGTPVGDGYSDLYSETHGSSCTQLLCGSMTLRNAQGQPTGTQMALYVTEPGTPSFDAIIVPTSEGSTSTIGSNGLTGGADISDLVEIDLGDGIVRVAAVCFYDYHGWEIAVDGRYPAFLVFERDPITFEWTYDASRSKTVDELHASAPGAFADDLFEEDTNSFAETYRFNPGMNEIAVCPVSGHILVTCYFASSTTNSGSVIAIDPASSEVVAYLRIPDFVNPDDGHDVAWAPREIQTDPSGTETTRAIVLGDCYDIDNSLELLPHTMIEVVYDPAAGTITQASAPCLPPLDDTDWACADWSPDGVLYVATNFVAPGSLAGLNSMPLNVFRPADPLPDPGEDYGTRAAPSYTVAGMAGKITAPFVMEQDPTTGAVFTVGAFGGKIRSWQPDADPDHDETSLALNPTFASNVDNWSARLFTCSSVVWNSGDSGRLAATGSGSASTMSVRQANQTLDPDSEGRSMIFSATVRAGTLDGVDAHVGVDFLNDAGTILSVAAGSRVETAMASTTYLYGDCVVPAGVTQYRIFVEWNENTAGDVHYVLENQLRFAPGETFPQVDITTSLFVTGQSNVRRGGIIGDTLAVVVQPLSTTHAYPSAPYDLDSYIVTVPISYLLGGQPEFQGLRCSFAPGFGPFDEDPAWVPITHLLLSGDTVDGKSADLEDFAPGEATLTFLNDDRIFDPDYEDGPYFGYLLPRVPFRLQYAFDDVVYDLYYGFVEDGFLPTYTPPAGATCTVTLVDMLAVINGYTLPGVFEHALKELDPVALWFLDGPAGAAKVADAVGSNEGTVFDEPQFGQDPLAPGLGTCAAFDGLNDRVDISRSWIWERSHEEWSVVSVIRTDTAAEVSSEHPIFMQIAGSPALMDIDMVNVHTDGTVQRYMVRAGDGDVKYNVTPVDDGETHLVIAQADPGAGTDYGVAIDSATLDQTGIVGAQQAGNGVAIGGTPFAKKDYTDNQFEGQIGVVAVFDYAFTEAQREDVLTGYSALDLQRSDEHIAWALDAIGVPASMYQLAEGESIMGPALTRGRNALDFLRSVARTEQGSFYVDHANGGVLRFDARFHSFTDTRSVNTQATFTDDPAAVDPFARVTPDTLQIEPNGVQSIINQATVIWRDGEEVIDESAGSTYGPRPVQVDTEATSANVARGIGQWIVALNDTPRSRVRAVEVDPAATGCWEIALGTRIRDRVSFRHHPQEVGDAGTKALEVLGRHHSFDGPEWVTGFYLTEAPADGVELFTLGTSELDGTHILAY